MKQPHPLPSQSISTGLFILLFLFVFAALPAAAGAQIFVDADAGGANNGTSWDDAYTTLQDALTTGFSGEIWVAEGVYFPDEGGLMIDNDRSATFQLFDGVEIYGGFDPGDNVDEFGERDWQAHPTILSGDIDGNDTNTDGVVTDTGDIDGGNSYNVVTGFGTGGTILLDGFIITAGLADDSANNSGAGMFNTDNSTVLTNVIFSGNSASFFGGGMYNLDSSPVLTNVTFSDNSAELGGGMFNDNSSSALTNVTLSNNSASVRGGGIYNDTSSSTLTNTILWGNTADFGGNEMYNESDGSATLNYSLYKNDEGDIVEGGGFTATNSLTADPLFVDPVNGDYSLQDTSPAINTGDPDTDLSLFPGGPGNPLDLAANPRLDAFIIDMGAYEVQGAPARFIPDENNILYVDKNVSGGNQTGDSWANGISELRDALDWAGNEWDGSNPPLQIWVADGIYTPTGDDTDRSATFRLVNNVEVYGGFDGGGGEENLTDRNIDAHPTILSGDIDGNDTTTDGVVTDTDDISDNNSFHVVTGDGTGGTALLDGFTVTAGLADEGGGGMINASSSHPTLANVIFSGNSASIFGGGMYNLLDSNPTLTNVTFSGNSVGFNGGGIYNESSSNPTLTNVIFTGNSADNDGGGIYNASISNPTLTNVIFSGNSAGESGGGLFNFNSNPSLTNVIIWDNEAGGVTTSMSSSIFNSGSNPDISHSLIANSGGSGTDWEDAIGNDGDNNIDTDPLFVDPTDPDGADDTFGTDDDGLALQDTSPAINTGDPDTDLSLFPGGPGAPIDLVANPRLDAVIIDMGAYEFQGASVPLIPDENNILYVDKNVSDGNQTGDSWANAIPELRDALDWAGNEWDGSSPPLQIWVADGLYLPTGDDTDRSATFRLVNNVEIYGGFEGGGSEDELSDRDIAANPAILSGDIGGDDVEEIISDPETEINGSNSFHVVTGSGTDGTALLDGFTVTAGLADGGGFDDFGGGMLNVDGSPALAGLTVIGNRADRGGGGMANYNSSPTLTNVIFFGNSADFSGGGMYNNDDSNPTLTNVTFSGNSTGGSGGGMRNGHSSNPTLTNVTFSGNSAAQGGGIYNDNSSPTLTNTIVWGNTAGSGGNEIYNLSSTATLDYSLYRNRDGESDIVEGDGFTATNSLTDDPLFTDPTDPDGADDLFGTSDDGLSLLAISPAVDAGDDAALPADTNDLDGDSNTSEPIPFDLAGQTRIQQSAVDIGAYESAGITPDGSNILYVDQNTDTEAAGYTAAGDSWDNAIPELRDALSWADENWDGDADGTLQIWTADGLYLPTGDDTDRSATFQLVNHVEVYGGFAGGEGNLSDRDVDANPAILSGDIEGDDTTTDGVVTDTDDISGSNSLHVVTDSGTDGTALLDGFTITAGLANGSLPDNRGGGMFNDDGNPALANLTVSGNSASFGGGIACLDCSITLSNSIFKHNFSSGDGGGMATFGLGSSKIINVLFYGNSAGEDGGGLSNEGHEAVLTNVTFTENTAGGNGGAIANFEELFEGSLTLTNVIIWGNSADGDGNEIYNDDSVTPVNINYSIFRDRDGVSDIHEVADEFTISNSLIADPLFVDPTDPEGADDLFGTSDDGLALQDTSPAINTGDPDTDLSLFPGGSDEPLDLAGNPRVFDGAADPDIIDMGAYEFQGEPFSPEADNGRVLASNLNGYTFTPAGFGQSDTDASVIVKTLPSNGDLELDGSAVTAADEIPVGDIDDGKLTYMPTAGDHGVNYDSFDFTVKESGIESDPFTMTIDVGTASLELTGGEGWRFLGNPSVGDSYEDLLSPIWTKGVPGSDSPGALFANVFNLDQSNYQWEAPSGLSNTTEPGRPFIVYVYSDDDNDGTPEGFPKTLTSGQNWLPLDGTFSYSTLDYDPDQGSEGNSHFLIANPHPVSLDFCGFTSTNVANSVNIWDPAANGGNGDYVSLSCGVDDVFIAPFQGFWVRTTDSSPVLEIPEAAYKQNPSGGYFKEKDLSGFENLTGLTLRIESTDGIFTNTARILFSEEASEGLDKWDAPKLSPAGLAERWLSFYSLDEEDMAYALQTLPTDFDEKLRIPLDIRTTESGPYILTWSLPSEALAQEGYFLRDNRTGQVVELREGAEYSFEIEPAQTSKVSETLEVLGKERSAKSPKDFADLGGDSEPRFELLIASSGIDGLTELGAVPEEFTLAQNYPNPFNPTTVISYQLPVNSEVRLEVFDMLGRNVATLVNGQVSAGRHTVNFDASNLSSGVYLYRLAAGSTIMTKKLTVVK